MKPDSVATSLPTNWANCCIVGLAEVDRALAGPAMQCIFSCVNCTVMSTELKINPRCSMIFVLVGGKHGFREVDCKIQFVKELCSINHHMFILIIIIMYADTVINVTTYVETMTTEVSKGRLKNLREDSWGWPKSLRQTSELHVLIIPLKTQISAAFRLYRYGVESMFEIYWWKQAIWSHPQGYIFHSFHFKFVFFKERCQFFSSWKLPVMTHFSWLWWIDFHRSCPAHQACMVQQCYVHDNQ